MNILSSGESGAPSIRPNEQHAVTTLDNSRHDFDDVFDSFKHSAFRLEALDTYRDVEEASDFERFLKGELFPESKNAEWCAWVQEQTNLSKEVQRVHVVSMPLTPYMRFEIDWRYIFNESAGERIYIIDRSKLPDLEFPLKDFWLFDDNILFEMSYDSEGRFLSAKADADDSSVVAHQRLAQALMSSAMSLRKFLSYLRTA